MAAHDVQDALALLGRHAPPDAKRCEEESDDDASREMAAAGTEFFSAALVAWRAHAPDFKTWTRVVGASTGRKGAALYMPLRAALTGRTHGPELAPLVALLGSERVAERIAAAGESAAA